MPAALALAVLQLADPRLEVHEFWVEQEAGPEHVFVIDGPLGPSPQRLSLRTTGPVLVDVDDHNATIDPPGPGRFRYEGLRAWDRDGHELPTWLVATEQGLDILFDDHSAIWPITVDPILWSNPDRIFTATQAGTRFGTASVSGDWNNDGRPDLVIGAPDWSAALAQEGAIFFYEAGANGVSTIAGGSRFGGSLTGHLGETLAACDFDADGISDLAVGEPGWNAGAGRVLIFRGGPGWFPASPSWTLGSATLGAGFGAGLAPAGDIDGDGDCELIVGAPQDDSLAANGGQVLLFAGDPAGLGNPAAWTWEGDQAGLQLGAVLSPAADLNADGYGDIVIGAPNHDAGAGGEGAVFVFAGSLAGLAATPDWTAIGTQAEGHFGASVSALGDVDGDEFADLLVGEPGYSDAFVGTGRGLVFLGTTFPDFVAEEAIWTTGAGEAGWAAGSRVLGLGDVNADGRGDFAIGYPGFDGDTTEGFIGVWSGGPASGDVLNVAWMDGPMGWDGNPPGWSLATVDVDGDGNADVLDCRPLTDAFGGSRCFAWRGVPGGHTYVIEGLAGEQAGSEFASALSSGGDVHGDGYDEVIVGAPAWDSPGVDAGRVFVYRGGDWGVGQVEEAAWSPGEPGARFGESVAGGGDMDGDGYDDIGVGAPGADGGAGRVYVYRGTISGLDTAPWFVEDGGFVGQAKGSSMSMGDLNGDGLAELAVGAPGYEVSGIQGGGVTIYMGAPGGPSSAYYGFLEIGQTGAAFGTSVAVVPDTNGDGFGDLLVGAPQWDGTFADEGKAFLFQGTADRPDSWTWWVRPGGQAGARMGEGVGSAGDLDGDGYGDIVVGAAGWDGAEGADAGWAGIFLGGPFGPGIDPVWESEGGAADDEFGSVVAWGGDTNDDGLSEILIGAPGRDAPTGPGNTPVLDSGTVYVVTTWEGSLGFSFGSEGFTQEGELGIALTGGFDSHGDGFTDLAFGSLAGLGSGNLEVLPGNHLDATYGDAPLRPRLLRPNGLPVGTAGALLGDTVITRVDASCPWGRCRARLETEWEPRGAVWDGDDRTSSGTFVDTGFTGVELGTTQAGLGAEMGWHGRYRVVVDPAMGLPQTFLRWGSVGAPRAMPHAWTPPVDSDGDGQRDASDCGPQDPMVHLGAAELADDGIDQDCDGMDQYSCRSDEDGDGAGGAVWGTCSAVEGTCLACFPDVEGLVRGTPDCDDADPTITVGTAEICDGQDNDCDGLVPAGEADGDLDGARGCEDCDDNDGTNSPGFPYELCDGEDNDCDGSPATFEIDADGDGVAACEGDCDDGDVSTFPGAPEAETGNDHDCDGVVGNDVDDDGTDGADGDCDDGDATVGPGQPEICDGLDNDCDGGFLPGERQDPDADGAVACLDCWEGNAAVFPGAPEACDGIDGNCDGLLIVDEADGDGDGVPTCGGDCDDHNGNVHPGRLELCGGGMNNGIDDDCDGTVDQDVDRDEDGFSSCVDDCDDGRADVHEGAPELCNGLDDDCSGGVDESFDLDGDGQSTCRGDCDDLDPSVFLDAPVLCEDARDNDCRPETQETVDVDGDGFLACPPDSSPVDCWEGNPLVHPGAEDVCDHVDDDCDGTEDEGWDRDTDGWLVCDGDCDDTLATIAPTALDPCGDGVDGNCDGVDPVCGAGVLDIVIPRGCGCSGAADARGGAAGIGWCLAALWRRSRRVGTSTR